MTNEQFELLAQGARTMALLAAAHMTDAVNLGMTWETITKLKMQITAQLIQEWRNDLPLGTIPACYRLTNNKK